jgi:hypothetical protein
MTSATLNHPKLQVSVQQFFKGVSWSGQLAPAAGPERSNAAAMIQTFHPTSGATSGESLSLMRSVRGFMANIPWTGGVAIAPASKTTTASSAPADLDAFSDFF